VKPEPLTETAVPPDPVLGERSILGTTVNEMPTGEKSPLGYVVTLTVFHVPVVDPAATLNDAESVVDPEAL
jgi:hypothetical protein